MQRVMVFVFSYLCFHLAGGLGWKQCLVLVQVHLPGGRLRNFLKIEKSGLRSCRFRSQLV